jgi:hypothetical protein
MKYKDRIFNETTDIENNRLMQIKDYNNINDYEDLLKTHISKWIN